MNEVCRTISKAYDYHNNIVAEALTQSEKATVCKFSSSLRIAAVVAAIISIALTILALSSGGFGGFLLTVTMGTLALIAKDAWTIGTNIQQLVDKEPVGVLQVVQNMVAPQVPPTEKNYRLVKELTADTWLLSSIATLGARLAVKQPQPI